MHVYHLIVPAALFGFVFLYGSYQTLRAIARRSYEQAIFSAVFMVGWLSFIVFFTRDFVQQQQADETPGEIQARLDTRLHADDKARHDDNTRSNTDPTGDR